MSRTLVLLCLALAGVLAIACSSSGAGGREVDITQNDDGCAPAAIAATPGEKLNLKVTNTTGKDYEVEGIEGANLEEVIIPGDRTREVGYNVPSDGASSKIKCYVPGGVSTIIEVISSSAGRSGDVSRTGTASASAGVASATVNIGLKEFEVTPSVTAVDAGVIEFNATNDSPSMVHELAVLRVKDDGTFENMGEIEGIEPGKGSSVMLDLASGKYVLACLIVPGEAGSTVDHYKEGMHTELTVR